MLLPRLYTSDNNVMARKSWKVVTRKLQCREATSGSRDHYKVSISYPKFDAVMFCTLKSHRANQAFLENHAVWGALGMLEPDVTERRRLLSQLSEDSPAGIAARAALKAAVEVSAHEYHGLGIEMNQHYVSSAVVTSAEGPRPPFEKDEVLYYEQSTYPGSRLPHVWLNTSVPGKPVSTIDLAGRGKFMLLTGIGGGRWKDAASVVTEELGLEIGVHVIGFRQEYHDMYSDWATLRGVEESGCVLVRPDRFVGWRCQTMQSDSTILLRDAVRGMLGI